MNITSAQYNKEIENSDKSIIAEIDGKKMFVPLDPANTDYAEILAQVKEGTLTIKDAD
tara:strand:+ start:1873 stop:2046 length:174 start_codon:yes stop_codon:yes gene_type:complete